MRTNVATSYQRLYELLLEQYTRSADIQISQVEWLMFISAGGLFGSGVSVDSVIDDMSELGLISRAENHIRLIPNKTSCSSLIPINKHHKRNVAIAAG